MVAGQTARIAVLVAGMALGFGAAGSPALARTHHSAHAGHHGGRHVRTARLGAGYGGAHVIQCVAFARQDTGIELSGNARNWWDNAAGVYARGNNPEVGSVLSFRATSRMRLGHVAVVSNVVSSRVVQIDQSHWAGNGISRDIDVVDVSPDNDWTQVRVALGHGNNFGSIYPTDGFIYARPDRSGVITPAVATSNAGASLVQTSLPVEAIDSLEPEPPVLHRHRHGLRRRHEITLEVAEAPGDGIVAPTR